MKVNIDATPKEIAALILAIQERQAAMNVLNVAEGVQKLFESDEARFF